MAKYDPRRPKHITNDDEPAQVDALLDLRDGGALSSGQRVASTDTDSSVESVDGRTTVSTATDTVVTTATQPYAGDDVLAGAVSSGSDVPVAPPPQEGTVNRAILGAVVTVVVAAVVAFLVLRRRRST